MLITSCHLTDKGLRIIDVDGSEVHITAEDALVLAMVIRKHEKALQEMIHRALEAQQEKKGEEHLS